MMKKTLKISAIIVSAGLVYGCASSGDVVNLQKQIDKLNGQVEKAVSDAAGAKQAADAASASAAKAASAAELAGSYAQDTNSKLDRMFKKTMMK